MPDWVLPIVGMMVIQIVALGGVVFAAGTFIGKVEASFKTIHKDILELTGEIRAERKERMEQVNRIWDAHNNHVNDHKQHMA